MVSMPYMDGMGVLSACVQRWQIPFVTNSIQYQGAAARIGFWRRPLCILWHQKQTGPFWVQKKKLVGGRATHQIMDHFPKFWGEHYKMYGMTISFSLLAAFWMENKALMAFLRLPKLQALIVKKYFVIVRCAGSVFAYTSVYQGNPCCPPQSYPPQE